MAVGDDLELAGRVLSDPLCGYNFLITLVETSDRPEAIASNVIGVIRDVALGGFSECSGLEMTLEVEERRAGGVNGAVLKYPSRVAWSNIRLQRGVTLSDDLWNWHYDFAKGKFGKRRDGIIVLQNDLYVPVKAWHFRRGLPVRWTGPTLNAARSEVAVESIEIAHEGLELLSLTSALDAPLDVSF